MRRRQAGHASDAANAVTVARCYGTAYGAPSLLAGILTAGQANAVNVAVNENPAERCLSLLSHMPTDQRRYRLCRLLHTGSND